jgi:Cu-processing system permease protein
MNKVVKYVWLDILQNRIVLAYTAFLLLVSFTLFGIESNSDKALMSLLTIVLLVVPLISLVFTTIHFYNSYEFTELLLAQPIHRSRLLLSEYAGVASSLVTAFLVGVGIPTLVFNSNPVGLSLLLAGIAVTLCFVSIAFLASVLTQDKAKGIGVALLLWFYFTMLYDGLVLAIMFSFSDYPLEKVMLVLITLNPVDLARIFLLLQTDISALMGYTGALYKEFFGNWWGALYAAVVMGIWVLLPLWMAVRVFRRKDL